MTGVGNGPVHLPRRWEARPRKLRLSNWTWFSCRATLPPPPAAAPRRCTSLWRVTQTLRDALLVAIRGVLSVAALFAAVAILGQRLHERCHRRRTSQFDEARRHGHA